MKHKLYYSEKAKGLPSTELGLRVDNPQILVRLLQNLRLLGLLRPTNAQFYPRIAKAGIHVIHRRIALLAAYAEGLHIEPASRREQTYFGSTTSRYKKAQVTINLSRTSLPQFHTSREKPNTSI